MQGNSTSARLQIVKNCQHDSTCKQQNIALHAIARMRPLHVNPSAACHGVKVVPMKSCLCDSCFPYLTGDLHTISKRFVRLWSLEPFTYIETVGAASPYMHAIKGRHALYMTCWVREYCRNRPFASVPRNIRSEKRQCKWHAADKDPQSSAISTMVSQKTPNATQQTLKVYDSNSCVWKLCGVQANSKAAILHPKTQVPR